MDYENKKTLAILKQMVADGQISQEVAEKYFPELAESENERMRKTAIGFIKQNKSFEYLLGTSKEDVIAWLEKQGEQKPADKVEPKFKVGDLVVNKSGWVWHIDSFDKKNYQVSKGKVYHYFPISKQNEMHLWTIQDAKDGDVLTNNGNIIIFEKIETTNRPDYKIIKSYCFTLRNIHTGRCFYVGGVYNLNDSFTPATKEQRDLLFQKMKEACYEWDAEKKELKEIKKKSEWSDEDKKMFKKVIEALSAYADKLQYEGFFHNKDVIQEYIDWLNTIHPQNHWKPTEAQLECLKEVCDEHWEPDGFATLYTLYEQLRAL